MVVTPDVILPVGVTFSSSGATLSTGEIVSFTSPGLSIGIVSAISTEGLPALDAIV